MATHTSWNSASPRQAMERTVPWNGIQSKGRQDGRLGELALQTWIVLVWGQRQTGRQG